jgi:glucokinase
VTRVIGIDLGGTKVAAAPLHGHEFGDSQIQPTDISSKDALLDQLVAIVGLARGDGPLDAVGIGVPSVVEFATGRVVASVNIPLADVPLRQVLDERLGVPVFVDNDATVAALAEAHDEHFELVAHNLVMLTLGTGVGGGIVLGGHIYRGATGAAGELGHQLVAVDAAEGLPPPTKFPQPGSLESIASGHALDRAAKELGIEGGGVALVEAADGGDAGATAAIRRWARDVGIGIANAINVFDPEEVVLGGGAARAGEVLLNAARDAALGYVLPGVGTKTTVRLARHGVRAGVLGAALLAAHELRHEQRSAHGAA